MQATILYLHRDIIRKLIWGEIDFFIIYIIQTLHQYNIDKLNTLSCYNLFVIYVNCNFKKDYTFILEYILNIFSSG